MDYKQSKAALVTKRAENFNLDRLLAVFVVENSVKEIRRDLMDIYFHSVNAITYENMCAGHLADALGTLQNIIKAVDAMEDIDTKHLEVKTV